MKIEMTAPALKSAVTKRTKEWLKHYILKGSEIAYSEGDSVALELRSQNWGAMPSFSFLSNNEIDNVIFYINYISEKKTPYTKILHPTKIKNNGLFQNNLRTSSANRQIFGTSRQPL